MPFVLDCSMTMSWIFPDESTKAGEGLRDSLVSDFALVPTLWAFEVGNVLRNATRRGRISTDDWLRIFEDLKDLPIEIDEESQHRVWESVLPIARKLDLTVYDAAYLELSMRHGLPLATLDRDLRMKAPMLGVVIIG